VRHLSDKQALLSLVPAAVRIFRYIEQHPMLRTLALDFEYAVIVDPDGARTVAKFGSRTCGALRGAVVWVSAIGDGDLRCACSHTLGSVP
jgi:hypothetical protein